jgi:hypothetical protein
VIPVARPTLADPDWADWNNRARKAMAEIVKEYEPGDEIDIDDKLYKEAMPFLLKLFNDKCAYCETVIGSNQPGDVEHYRPKGRLRDHTSKVVRVKVRNTEMDHPGYWWLAYDWLNLLPSCIDCNRRRRHGADQALAGKADLFEVRGSRAALPNDDLKKEQPLLLDPSTPDFDAAKHFEFCSNGQIKPLTDEAQYSCELLGLNIRETLVAQRELGYTQAQQALAFLVTQVTTASAAAMEFNRKQINDMWEGRGAYSAFARAGLEEVRNRFWKKFQIPIPLPLPPPSE